MSEMVERVANRLKQRFAAMVAEHAGIPFDKTDVRMPTDEIWRDYASAAIDAISPGWFEPWPPTGWLPMDTAPRDGSEVLLFVPGSRIGALQEEPDRVFIGFWRRTGFVHQTDDHLGVNATMWKAIGELPKVHP